MLLVLFCIHVNHLCTLYLFSFLAVVYRGPHGRLAFFVLLNVLPSENKDYYYYYYYLLLYIVLKNFQQYKHIQQHTLQAWKFSFFSHLNFLQN